MLARLPCLGRREVGRPGIERFWIEAAAVDRRHRLAALVEADERTADRRHNFERQFQHDLAQRLFVLGFGQAPVHPHQEFQALVGLSERRVGLLERALGCLGLVF